jgi:hypothetical protein
LDFYEIGVYLVLIVVASTCVFGVMWLLMKSMQPKRPMPRRQVAPALVAGKVPKQLTQGPAAKGKKKENNKKSRVKKEKLIELRELPDGKLLPEGQAATGGATKQTKPGFLLEKKEDKQADVIELKQPGSRDSKPKAKNEAQPQKDDPAEAEIALPDLPSMDTMIEVEEETGEQQDQVDLMSVFESEETEDSATSDLAANLFDVDVQNIERLSSEVAEFLGGMRSK